MAMAKITDLIEQIIDDMLDNNDGYAEIVRGELAERANCVPSQVTYVISTRFTSSQGYRVESRRGGGGSIKIYKVDISNDSAAYIMHVVNSLGDSLSQQQADVHIKNFHDYRIIDTDTARLFKAATSNSSLEDVEASLRGQVRMKILKNMLVELILKLN